MLRRCPRRSPCTIRRCRRAGGGWLRRFVARGRPHLRERELHLAREILHGVIVQVLGRGRLRGREKWFQPGRPAGDLVTARCCLESPCERGLRWLRRAVSDGDAMPVGLSKRLASERVPFRGPGRRLRAYDTREPHQFPARLAQGRWRARKGCATSSSPASARDDEAVHAPRCAATATASVVPATPPGRSPPPRRCGAGCRGSPVGSRSVNASGIRVRKDRIASSHSRTLRCHSASPSAAAWRLPCTTTLRQRKRPFDLVDLERDGPGIAEVPAGLVEPRPRVPCARTARCPRRRSGSGMMSGTVGRARRRCGRPSSG